MKKCTICEINKELSEFRYRKDRKIYYSQCKECEKIYKKKNYLDRINENKEYSKNYYKNNREKIILYVTSYQKKNNTWMKKYHTDPIFKMNHNLRCRIREFLTSKKFTKKNETKKIIGCSQLELKEFLEKKFKNGMMWENYGEWHIDHIIPLSSAENEEEIYKLCHYTNLQPLWSTDNWKKGNRLL